MNQLHIYPTSRALREVSHTYKTSQALLPTLMRIDSFEQRVILLENTIAIDPMERILLLQKATNFEAFKALKLDRSLVRFFTKSDALFKFFEELSAEKIDFEMLANADAYAEFSTHLEILQSVLANYKSLLQSKGYTDRAFVPECYQLNEAFIQSYEKIEVHLEGYLSHFELTLLEKVSDYTPLIIHYTTSKFNLKMQERFKQIGITVANNSDVVFSLSEKKVLQSHPTQAKINAQVYALEQRQEQIAVAFAQIEQMVQSGIDPQKIALILPDEKFKEHLMLFDKHHNLNFAMGYDYSSGYIYKSLQALYSYWQQPDNEHKKKLERYGINLERMQSVAITKKVEVGTFFEIVTLLELDDSLVPSSKNKKSSNKKSFNEVVHQKYIHFANILSDYQLTPKVWLFLWLKALSKVSIDDVRGGKITVMGVLETRGVAFEGVVIIDFNEGVVPATSSKDQFLNSQVRAFANLPTKNDREALQKQYYKRLLEQANSAVILYSTSDNKLPSKFLYELGLEGAKPTLAQFALLYNEPTQLQTPHDPLVEDFDAHTIIWSASRLKTYLECKRKYYYRYIQKLQAKKEEERNEGAFLHSLLEHLHRHTNRYESSQQMQKQIDMLLEMLLPHQDAKTAYQKLLWRNKLKGFVQSQITHFKSGWSVIEREKEFQGTIGGLSFKGRIDRIDQNESQTLVVDYKSGSTTEAQKTKNIESLNDLQMSIYHQMLMPLYPHLTLAFVKLFEEGKIEEIGMLEQKNKRLDEVIAELKQTKQFVAEKCEDLQKCQWCEFTLMCERGEYL